MKRWRRPPLQHPLAPVFAHAVESLSTALAPSSKRNYDIVVRSFLVYLGTKHPGGYSARTTAPRSSYPRLDVPFACADSAPVHGNLYWQALRSAHHLP